MKHHGTADWCHFVTCKVTAVSPLGIVPVEKIIFRHQSDFIYQTFPHHQRAGGNRIGIFDSGNSVCIGFSKEFGFGTVVFKIHNLPELLDNTRIFHVIHARTCHAAVRVCVQKLHQLTHCIFINQHIIVQTIQIFVSFFQSFPQSGIKSTRTTEILCVDKHRYLTAVLFTDCFCRTVWRSIIYNV